MVYHFQHKYCIGMKHFSHLDWFDISGHHNYNLFGKPKLIKIPFKIIIIQKFIFNPPPRCVTVCRLDVYNVKISHLTCCFVCICSDGQSCSSMKFAGKVVAPLQDKSNKL